ncbi:DUF2577 domain-containing protein [Cohnella lupini]|uniref:Uncharacterized protein DUF2577 n=1 Tax=Cohnella lupini TaxID=1294267 RepID=A0A3D9ISL9_9BACL|nr:DUF2577 domain-containing protein [Cohnella lupini]RED64675.1 uncharacterized protein DUF2577 [Cohnella lupini]
MSLLEIMKKAGVGAVEATNPVTVLYGQVVEVNPLSVLIDQRFILSEELLLIPESLRECKVLIGSEEVTIREALAKDDYLLLLRAQGGQQYIILDRVVKI